MLEIAELVINQAKELTACLRDSHVTGRIAPPLLAEDYAPLVGITRVLRMDLGDLDALLLPERDGLAIKLNSGHHPLRQNFSFAHEIAHVLVDKALYEIPPNSPAFRSSGQIDRKFRERLCERVAAELLMPESLFLDPLKALGVSVNSVRQLARLFFTSIPATARRIAELSQEPCLALYWRLVKRPRWKQSKPCLIWAAPDQEFSDWLYEVPRFVSVSQRSSVFQAFQSKSMVAAFECFPLGNVQRPFYMESKAFGQKPRRYIVSLVFPERNKASHTISGKCSNDPLETQASLGI